MKNKVFILIMIALVALVTCKKDEPITATDPPQMKFISDEAGYQEDDVVRGAQGQTMTVRAEFTDDVGIQSFRLSYLDWNLDNTVNLTEYYPDETLKKYQMEYYFEIPSDADESKSHEIKLTVTNLGNLSSEAMITVLLDGDYEAPQITNLYPGNNSTVPAEDMKLTFDATDNIALRYIVVEVPSHNLYDSITNFPDPKFYHYRKFLTVQTSQTYTYNIRVADHFNHQAVQDAVFNIGTPEIIHMFLVDKSTQEELDKGFIGTTLRMVPAGVESEHAIVYYCAEPGTELRFMDHFNSFFNAFNLFGVEGNELIENGMEKPYVLNDMGYYTITINTDLLTFDISGPVAPDDLVDAREVPDDPWLYGRGVDGNHGGWDTYSDYMTEDPNNKYLFHLETELGDAEYDGYCEGCIGIELLGSTEWNDEYIWDDIVWFGYQWFQDGIIDEIDEDGGKPDGWAGLAGELETWSDDEENYWNTWADMSATYEVTLDMYTRRTRIFKKK